MVRHKPIVTFLGLWLALAFSAVAQPTQLFYESFDAFPGVAWTVGDDNSTNGANYWGSVDAAYGGEGTFAGNFKGYCAARTPSGSNLTAVYPVNMRSFASRALNLTGFSRANLRFGFKVPSIGAGDSWRVQLDGSVVASGTVTQTNWVEHSLNINNFTGVNRTLRFEFISDASGTAEGLYLDGIEATAANSNVTETFGVPQLTNYTGYIIDADAANNSPNFNREGLNVTTSITVENFQTTVTNLPYRFTYWLRDTNGNAFPIRTVGGTTNAAQNYVATNSVSLGNGDRGVAVNTAVLLPIGRLSHLTSYRIECEIARTNGVVISRTTNAPHHFYHFVNTASGDASLNVIVDPMNASLERTWMVNTCPDANSFVFTNRARFVRYDDFADAAAGLDNVPVRFELELRHGTTDALIPLVNSVVVTNIPVFNYEPLTSNPPKPRSVEVPFRIEFRPVAQLNSVDAQYRLVVRMSHTNQVGQPGVFDGGRSIGPARFLHYNGTLLMGDITATMTNWAAGPIPGIVAPGVHINTVIHLGNKGAYVNGSPLTRFGDGLPLGTYLRVDGTTQLAAGTQTSTSAGAGEVGNVKFLHVGVTFSPSGAEASTILFLMPSGFGWTTNIDFLGKRMLESELMFSNVALGPNLAPKVNLTLVPPANAVIYTSEESKPFYLVGSALTWDAANSRFIVTPTGIELVHHRRLEYYILEFQRNNLLSTSMADHRSNDRLYDFVDKINGDAYITADANGTARLTVDITFKAQGGFVTHFPYENFVGWNNGGTMSVVNDEVTVGPASRLLTGGTKIVSQYSGDCEGCGAMGTNHLVGLAAPGGELRFTRDGGLVTLGTASPEYAPYGLTNKLAWGFIPSKNDYAQSVLAPTNVAFHMPGSFLLGQYNTSAKREDAAGVLLLTGVAATNHSLLERPLTAAYKQGRADYAGLNFRVLEDGFRFGRSVLAGQQATYQLRGNSKYYARRGGVSGRHSALGGTFPDSLTLLGYGLTFSNYSLAYLDSRNVASKTDGLLRVPYPSNFELPFAELDFTCPGGLDHATIQNGSVSRKLEWWDADFDALAIQFATQPGEECDPGQGSLTVGVRAFASHIDEPLSGVLGFKTNGTLIAAADNVAGIDSRLSLPVTFQFTGPDKTNVNYNVTTVGRAYYAAYNSDENKVPHGFLNFVGKLDVPFFEDIKIHAHVSAKKGQDGKVTPIYLMGGWPRSGSGEANQGWRDGADDYFNKPGFDPSNRGYPSAVVQIANYRKSPTTQYKPRAQKHWLDVVEFDYPLNWDSSSRQFTSAQSVSNSFFVVQLKHEVKSLNAKTADLTFGATYEAPRISVGSLVADLGESSGVLDMISDAIGDSDAGFLVDGLDAFGSLVGEGAEKISKTIVDEAVMPVLEPAYESMKAAFASKPIGNKWAFTNDMVIAISNLVGQITNAILVTADYTSQGSALIKDINLKLGKVEQGITSAAVTLLKASNAPVVASKALSKVSPTLGQNLNVNLSNLVEKLEPFLKGASHTLTNLKQYIPPIRKGLTNGGEFAMQLDKIVKTATPEILAAAEIARKEVVNYFMSFDYSVDDPFSHMGKEQMKEYLRLAFEKRLMQTEMMSKLKSATKHRFYDADASFRGALDSYFTGINGLVRSVLEAGTAPLDDAINGALDSVKNYMGASKLTGHALINEDSLRLLRIDGSFKFKVPEEIQFGAFVEIKELDSENTFEGCEPEGGTATEVRLGATQVPLKWLSPGLKASIGIGWVTGADGDAKGVSGMFDMTGKLKFGGFTVQKAGFAVAFGENENYLAANCRAKAGKSVDIAAGLFFGRACSYDPLKVAITAVSTNLLKDLPPDKLFGPPPFTGGLIFAEGTFPVWSYGCLMEIRMTVGGGGWYFVEGPRYGGIIKVGAQGTVICVLNGGFEGTVIGSQKNPDEGMVYVGSIKGNVSIGWCDFCIEESDEAIWKKVGDGDFERIDK